MATTNAHELEAHPRRALLYADRLFLALEEIECARAWRPPWPTAAPKAGTRSGAAPVGAGPARRRAGGGRPAAGEPAAVAPDVPTPRDGPGKAPARPLAAPPA